MLYLIIPVTSSQQFQVLCRCLIVLLNHQPLSRLTCYRRALQPRCSLPYSFLSLINTSLSVLLFSSLQVIMTHIMHLPDTHATHARQYKANTWYIQCMRGMSAVVLLSVHQAATLAGVVASACPRRSQLLLVGMELCLNP